MKQDIAYFSVSPELKDPLTSKNTILYIYVKFIFNDFNLILYLIYIVLCELYQIHSVP